MMRDTKRLGRRSVVVVAALCVACGGDGGMAEAREPAIVRRAAQSQGQAAARDSAARGGTPFVQHPEHIQVGLPLQGGFAQLANPFEGDARKAAEGGALFVSYNCADCHGAEGSGAMGPSLADGRWHFGGTAGAVFQSIYEGRPDGMPSWGGRIPDDQIWRLVAYVQSLGKGKDLSTENFTGKAIPKMGH
jgi:cytochrome c oxidase cbb3-type subunit 3